MDTKRDAVGRARGGRWALACLVVAACQGTGRAPTPSRAPARGGAGDEHAIAGTVVDASGRPVKGARVALVPVGTFDPSGARFVHVDSAADGGFRLVAGAERYGITATSPDGTAAWVSDREAGQAGVRLSLGGGGRRLFGRVLDRDGGARAGAEVRLARGLGEEGDVFLIESGAGGHWSALVPDGDYAVSAAQSGSFAAQKALPRGRDSVDVVLDPVWPPGPPPPAVVDWLRAHESPLSTTEPGTDLADLAPLRAIVGEARVVGLGEATHGTREIFQLKHRIVEFLVREMGFTVFAIEIGLPEALAIDDYVLGGEGDPEALLAAQFVAVWQTEELADLVRWLRTWNRTHTRKVHFHGVDMRRSQRAAKATLTHGTSPIALEPLADPFTYDDVMRRPKPELAALLLAAREFAVRSSDSRHEEAPWRSAMQARVLAQTIAWRAAADTAASVRVRESSMADNVMSVLEHRGPDARAIVWAHNTHIAGHADAEPRMMGVHLRERLGTAYRALGSAIDRGAYQAIDPSGLLHDFTIPPAAPGSLENALAVAGRPIALVDLRTVPATGAPGAWFRAFQATHQFDGLYDDPPALGWETRRVIAAREFDALMFVASGVAARALPLARAVHTARPSPATPPVNLDMEDANDVRAWQSSPDRNGICGYALALDREHSFTGRASARIARTRMPDYGDCAGKLQQRIDALPYRGKRIHLRAAVHVEAPGEHAHLYLKTGEHRTSTRASGSGFHSYDVMLDVPGDATSVDIGLAFDGKGRAWLDAVCLSSAEGTSPCR